MIRSAQRRARGFTLVELMVSLVAGVIIAIAVVGLAKAATTSFHEQVRLTTVEQSVRNAANRLRYDLTKVSFMGTGNIKLASGPNVPYGHRVAVNGSGQSGDRYGTMTKDLQGIRIRVGKGTLPTQGTLGLATNNGLSPDELLVVGNMTTDDQYVGTWEPSGGSCGGGQITLRAAADPANARLINGSAQNVINAFTPAPGMTFLARVVDEAGCQHFVTVNQAAAPTATGPNAYATIDLCNGNDNTSVLWAHLPDPTDTRLAGPKGTGCGVDPLGTVRISPLHRVRWFLAKNTDPLLDPPPAIGDADSMFMLYRGFEDASGTLIPQLTQVVAEYAIDLKFGIAVDDSSQVPPANIRVFDLDSDTQGEGGGGPIDLWTNNASATTAGPGQPGPQRIRSVKFRVSTRAPLADRTANLSLLPGTPYITRYCLEAAAPATCTKFARVRTIVSEVALINQARMAY